MISVNQNRKAHTEHGVGRIPKVLDQERTTLQQESTEGCSSLHPKKPLAKEGVFSHITWSGKLPRFRNKEDVLVIWGKSSFRGVAQAAGRLTDRGLHKRGTRETQR